MIKKIKIIYEIVFNLKKNVICSTMLKSILLFKAHQKFISMNQWDRKFKLYLETDYKL